jgi:hypothetical protein
MRLGRMSEAISKEIATYASGVLAMTENFESSLGFLALNPHSQQKSQ